MELSTRHQPDGEAFLMNTRHFFLSCCCGLSLALTTATFADEENHSIELEEVSISASGAEADSGGSEQGYRVKNTRGVGIWDARSLQDTPYSIHIISEELIENQVAKDMNQIFKINPTTEEVASIASDATGNRGWVNIRGFRVNNPIINGISYASRVASTPAMQDIERVEIINGATGFLYGGGRVGGAVNYITKKPTLEPLFTVASGSYGGSTHFLHLDAGGQFNREKTFGYRINTGYQDGQNARKDERQERSFSLALDARPVEALTVDLRYSHLDSKSSSPTIFWDGNYHREVKKKNQTFTPDWQRHFYESNKMEAAASYRLSPALRIRTSLMYDEVNKQGGDMRIVYKEGKALANSWFGDISPQKNRKIGGSFYLDVAFDTFGVAHHLSTGYSFAADKSWRVTGSSASHPFGHEIPLGEVRHYPKPSMGSTGWGSSRHSPRGKNNRTAYENILVGDDIVFNEQWFALVGFNHATTISQNYTRRTKYDKSALTPTLSISYKPLEELTTYITYIESLETGEEVSDAVISGSLPPLPAYVNAGEILDPYISKQYETGMKYSFHDRLSINSALFRIEKANRYDITLPSGQKLRSHDGEQVHQGIELGAIGKLSDHLSLIAGGTVMDLAITKTDNPQAKGKKPTGTAAWMAKTTLEYQVPHVPGLALSAGAYRTGKKYDDAANREVVPAYTLYDMGLRYAFRLDRKQEMRLNLGVQNLTDKVYWPNNSTMGDPRSLVFRVQLGFH